MNFQTPRKDFEPPAQSRGIRERWQRLDLSPARLRRPLMILGPTVVLLVAAYMWITGGRYVSTDNAYIHAPKLSVSTDVSGLVQDVMVKEGQYVKKGDVLFTVDPTAFKIAVENAKAQLDLAALNLESMKVDYKRLMSDIASQEAQVQLAQVTFDRAATLIKTGATTVVAYDQARFALNAAKAQNQSLVDQAKVALAKLGGNPDIDVTKHPTYLQIKAALDEAQRQLDHTIVRAPFDGVATQVSALQPGMFLVAATAGLTNTGVVALVGTESLWIDANFKETDLTYAKPGDKVSITVDTYPGQVWTGRVDSISPASGSEFSILPAQNASGNWVKVVQRIPVRIVIDPKTDGPALRTGMSVITTIDTKHRRRLSELW